MTEFVIGVVAHEKRSENMERLQEQVAPDYVSVDDGTLGCGGNHLAVLRACAELAGLDQWIVILEDDALPIDSFRDQLGLALAKAPSPLASLYCGTGYPAQYQRLFEEAVALNTCWIMHAQMRHAVAYAVHGTIVRGLLVRMEQLIPQRWAPDDAIGKWAMETRTPVSYSNPSLVDHDDSKTVIDYRMHLGRVSNAGRNRVRKAHSVGSRDVWDRTQCAVKGGGYVVVDDAAS